MSATEGLSEPAARLARCLSSTTLVEPALLRKMRLELVKEATVAAELEISDWLHVETQSSRGLTFDRTSLAALREDLAQSKDWRAAIAIVEACHEHAPTLVRLEEEIVALSLRRLAGKLTKQDFADKVEAKLAPVLSAMAEPGKRRLLVTWAARALSRLPSQVMACSAAKILSFVSSATLPGVVSLTKALSAEEAKLARPLLDGEHGAAVYLRWVDDTIELVARTKPRTGHWHLVHLPDADPLFVFVGESALVLDPGKAARVHATPGSEVVIRSVDGRAWKLVRGDASKAIAEISGGSSPGFGYLVDDGVVITTSEAVGSRIDVAFFGIRPTGRELAVSDRVTRAVVVGIPTAERMDVEPQLILRLSLDLTEGKGVRFLVLRLPDGDKWLHATIGPYFPQDGLFELRPTRPLSTRERERICGSPILDDTDLVVGHVRNVIESEDRILACPSQYVLRTIGKTRTIPRSIRSYVEWTDTKSGPQFILRLLPGLHLSSVGLLHHPAMTVHADYPWGRLWWSPEAPDGYYDDDTVVPSSWQSYTREIVTLWSASDQSEEDMVTAGIAGGSGHALHVETTSSMRSDAPGLVIHRNKVVGVMTTQSSGDLYRLLKFATTFTGAEEEPIPDDGPLEIVNRVWRTIPYRCLAHLVGLGPYEYEQLKTDRGLQRLLPEAETRARRLEGKPARQAMMILEFLRRNRRISMS